MKKKFCALFVFVLALFQCAALADINWEDDLPALLEKAKAQNKAVMFVLAPEGDKTIKSIPEFKDEKFSGFAEDRLLFCKVKVAPRGNSFKILNREYEDFLAKFLPEFASVKKDGYCVVLFRHPDVYEYAQINGSMNFSTFAPFHKFSKADFGDAKKIGAAAKESASGISKIILQFLYGKSARKLADTGAAAQTSGEAKILEPSAELSPEKLAQIAKSENKYIVFVICKNPKSAFARQATLKNPGFKAYAAQNFIFVLARTLSAGEKFKLADGIYAGFIDEIRSESFVYGNSFVSAKDAKLLFYHPGRTLFEIGISEKTDSYGEVYKNCEKYKIYSKRKNTGVFPIGE